MEYAHHLTHTAAMLKSHNNLSQNKLAQYWHKTAQATSTH